MSNKWADIFCSSLSFILLLEWLSDNMANNRSLVLWEVVQLYHCFSTYKICEQRVYLLKALSLRYHFIKNALPVSRFHNQIFKETIQLLRYIYIYEI